MRYKIFVSIVSYRDPLLEMTVDSLFDQQSGNHDIVISILDQSVSDFKYKDHPNIIYKQINPEYTNGVGWARHLNSLNITNEDFYYQIDSHSLFDKNWDEYLIKDFITAKQKFNTNKLAFSNACKNFFFVDNLPVKECEFDNRTIQVKFIETCKFMDNKYLNAHGNFHKEIPEGEVLEAIHLHAGNFFTHSDYIRDVGINHNFFFFGEEQYLTLISFAYGYKLLHHTSIHNYHFQNTQEYISKVWYEPVIDERKIDEMKRRSIDYWNSFINSIDVDILLDFYTYSGVNYITEEIDDRALTHF
jgi:hypothetical protein